MQPTPSTLPLTPTARTAVMFLALGLFVGCCSCLGRGFTIFNWLTWPHMQAVYVGSAGTSSSRSGGAVSCERRYQQLGATDGRTWSQSAPCFVLIGPRADEGEVVSLAIQPNGGPQCVSATEAFGMGFLDLFGVLLLLGPPAVLLTLLRRGTLRGPPSS